MLRLRLQIAFLLALSLPKFVTGSSEVTEQLAVVAVILQTMGGHRFWVVRGLDETDTQKTVLVDRAVRVGDIINYRVNEPTTSGRSYPITLIDTPETR
jgi:hypothetical protein